MSIRLIVGLGNPGVRYENSRHNVGFMVVDRIFEKHSGGGEWSKKHEGLLASVSIEGREVLLLKPMTMMNDSGMSVSEVCRYSSISTDEIMVVHDDIDLSFASIRIKEGGGDGGHNGLRSIDRLRGNGYRRLRFGVGRPSNEFIVEGFSVDRELVSRHVLSNFSKEEKDKIDELIEKIAERAEILLEDLDTTRREVGELRVRVL